MHLLCPYPAVVRYDLEFLGLCPCMVDVEIIDAKAGNSSTIVSAGEECCVCNGNNVAPSAAAKAGSKVGVGVVSCRLCQIAN